MQTSFTVSNTDVITMLVVKHREQLEQKREQLRLEYIKEKDIFNKKIQDSYNKQIKKVKPELIEAFKLLVATMNPGKSFEISIGDSDFYIQPEYDFVVKENYIDLSAKFNTEYYDEQMISQEGNVITTPCKININFKKSEKAVELSNQIHEIDSLLKNENKMKEKLIAKITENAIKNLPEINSLITDDILALS